MASHTARIGIILAQVQKTANEVQEALVLAKGYLADSNGTSNYPIAAETTEQALMKTVALFEQLRALRSALGKVKPTELQDGSAG